MKCPIMSAVVGLKFQKVSEPDTNFIGKCSIAVSAYLQATTDHRLEVKQSLRDRD